jgi:sulfur-oxidizing protein SoxX
MKFDKSFPARLAGLGAVALLVAGCASLSPSPAELDAQFKAMMQASFRDQGIAKVDRLQQDLGQAACSTGTAAGRGHRQAHRGPVAGHRQVAVGRQVPRRLERGRKARPERPRHDLDRQESAESSANGGNCYNCHQISKQEISFGTIGPSLYNYGKLRGVTDPASPAVKAIVEYTWGKI